MPLLPRLAVIWPFTPKPPPGDVAIVVAPRLVNPVLVGHVADPGATRRRARLEDALERETLAERVMLLHFPLGPRSTGLRLRIGPTIGDAKAVLCMVSVGVDLQVHEQRALVFPIEIQVGFLVVWWAIHISLPSDEAQAILFGPIPPVSVCVVKHELVVLAFFFCLDM